MVPELLFLIDEGFALLNEQAGGAGNIAILPMKAWRLPSFPGEAGRPRNDLEKARL
jgi:hypothetical protein